MNNNLKTEFFLGVNTLNGFYSTLNNLCVPYSDWFYYILKGGPGTGKSTLMKKIAKKAQEKNLKTELIYCSSDPKSLDAVIIPEAKKCIIDGTAPHVIDPIYPGACDCIINLGECWDKKKLQSSKNEIIELSKQNATEHSSAQKALKIHKEISELNNKIISKYIETEKLEKYCVRTAKSLGKAKKSNKGKKTFRFISSITPNGYIFFENTISNLAKNIFVIEDEYNIVANKIMKSLQEKVLDMGYDVISCLSPFSPETTIDAIIIPELKTAFAVKNQKISPRLFKKIPHKKVNAKRFLNSKELSKQKNTVKFQSKLSAIFLDKSIEHLRKALEIHDDIEKIYSSAMNYRKVNKLLSNLIF